jgi:PleD family two-component response regulator
VSDLEHASSIAKNLRRAIGATDMKRGVRVTVSAGVAQYRLWESAEETLGRAEQALHLAKQFGRDRVEVAASPKSSTQRAEVIPLQPTA